MFFTYDLQASSLLQGSNKKSHSSSLSSLVRSPVTKNEQSASMSTTTAAGLPISDKAVP
jgi:hypothetical protein